MRTFHLVGAALAIGLGGCQTLGIECAPGCFRAWLGDGECDPACNVPACDNDQHDCEGQTRTPAPTQHEDGTPVEIVTWPAASPSLGRNLVWFGAFMAVAGLAGWAAWSAQRQRRKRASWQRVISARALDAGDVALIYRLAALVRAEPEAFVARVDLFERASGSALAEDAAPELAAAVAQLRSRLGFNRLPEYFPLLTSRELRPGAAVRLSDIEGRVGSVTERFFEVQLLGQIETTVGTRVPLSVHVERDADYDLTCPVIQLGRGDAGTRVVLGHDEAPVRLQRRQTARAALVTSVELVPSAKPSDRVVAMTSDLSAGGMRVSCRWAIPIGTLLEASFEADGHRFNGLRGVVLECAASGDRFEVRIEFRDLGNPVADRLAQVVARHTSRASQPVD